jgi:hypothetical protein
LIQARLPQDLDQLEVEAIPLFTPVETSESFFFLAMTHPDHPSANDQLADDVPPKKYISFVCRLVQRTTLQQQWSWIRIHQHLAQRTNVQNPNV